MNSTNRILAAAVAAGAAALCGCASTSDVRALAAQQADDRAQLEYAIAALRQTQARLALGLDKAAEAGARDRRAVAELREEVRAVASGVERRHDTLAGSHNTLVRAFNHREQFLSRLKVMTLPNGMTVLYIASE